MPQRIRHRVVFLAFLTSVLLYLDRFVLSYTERLIKLDLGLTEDQISWGLSAFFWSYALFQVPSGLLTDRYGPRRMLTIYILLWSLGTALMGWINGFGMLIAVRLGIGLAQAGAYPTCAAIVGRWVPLKSRGTASGLIAVGGRIGGGIAPLLTAFLVMHFAAGGQTAALAPRDLIAPFTLAERLTVANPGGVRELPADWSEDRRARKVILHKALPDDPVTIGAIEFVADNSFHQRPLHNPQTGEIIYANTHARNEALFGLPPGADDLEIDRNLLEHVTEAESLQNQMAELLQRIVDGPLIASEEDLKHLPVEPAAQRIAAKTSPDPEEVRLANRLILEAALPGLIRPLYSTGWRPVMWVYGAAGILIAALFWLVVRDWPQQHPRISEAELDEINAGRPPQATTVTHSRPPLPFRAMVTSTSLWLISASQFFANIAWTFLVLQLPRYLQEAHHLSFADRSLYASIPLWCGWGGMFVGGIVTDHCVRRFGLRLGRVIPLAGSRLLGTAAFLGLLLEPSLPMALALLSLVAVAADFASPATWAFNQDIGGRFIASTLGWGNMWGNIGSALSPLILTSVLKQSGSWTGPFLVCASTYAVAGLCTLFIDPRQSIDVHD